VKIESTPHPVVFITAILNFPAADVLVIVPVALVPFAGAVLVVPVVDLVERQVIVTSDAHGAGATLARKP
jgi:ribosomal 30S subunit maturation factor RimM